MMPFHSGRAISPRIAYARTTSGAPAILSMSVLDLTLTPYADTNKCTGPRDGRAHRCGARLAYSLRATGIREFSGLVSTAN